MGADHESEAFYRGTDHRGTEGGGGWGEDEGPLPEARRLKELEAENSKLKKLLAESELDKAALKDLLGRKW